MRNRFTEQDTETFYDAEDALYRSFWDSEGSLHWGLFDDSTGGDFLQACANLNRIMSEKAGITPTARVLDLGCGNGNTATWLGRTTGCHVTGVDLSSVRIGNARASLASQPEEMRSRLRFEKASATDLPFEDGTFTHVWSQATLYHVHEREAALQEAYRVLAGGGTLIFDDLVKPKQDISPTARTYVYDRLLFDTDFSFSTYQDALRRAGFQVGEAQDLSAHLKSSYHCLSEMAAARGNAPDGEKFHDLSQAYLQMVQAIENEELGWAMYLCHK